MKLIAFPHPAAGESVAGYFFRLAKENGFNNPKYLFEKIFGKEAYRYNRISLGDLYGMTEHQSIENLWLTYEAPFYYLEGVVIPKNHILEQDHRWCPLCWKEAPIMKCVWHIGWMPVCDVHETLLLDRCTACGDHIHYKHHVASCKQCGELVADMATAPAPAEVVAAQKQNFAAIWKPKNYHHYSKNPTVQFFSGLLHNEEVKRRANKKDPRAAPRAHYWLSVADTISMYERILASRQSA